MAESAQHSRIPAQTREYYERGFEVQRLRQGLGELEKVRTQELLSRFLPPPPAVIFDVGGGPGVYACWLATQGYEVHLVDLIPLHVEQALKVSSDQPACPLAGAIVGDARKLNRADSSVDVVLLLGPLYHLVERNDRLGALREARRVVQKGGRVLAAGISRLASLLAGLGQALLEDPEFVRIVQRDLCDGQHRNPTGNPEYFTTAFFHYPENSVPRSKKRGSSTKRHWRSKGRLGS